MYLFFFLSTKIAPHGVAILTRHVGAGVVLYSSNSTARAKALAASIESFVEFFLHILVLVALEVEKHSFFVSALFLESPVLLAVFVVFL